MLTTSRPCGRQVEEDFAGRSPHTPGTSGKRSSAAGGRRRGMDSGQDNGRALVRTLSMAEAAGRTMGKMHVGLPTLAEQQPAAKGEFRGSRSLPCLLLALQAVRRTLSQLFCYGRGSRWALHRPAVCDRPAG